VPDAAVQPLALWQSFYVIVGSSGAALIGIQFVVIALVAGRRKGIATADAINAFATPTVVHLGGALVVSALMSAPWTSLPGASLALATCGLAGLGYAGIVMRRARRQTTYEPVLEDWVWYAAFPSCAYAALAAGALLLRTTTDNALFVVAAAALGLLLIGIHNAWDTVTHVVAGGRDDATETE
jgi:hypothetical protein